MGILCCKYGSPQKSFNTSNWNKKALIIDGLPNIQGRLINQVQIFKILQEGEAGVPIPELARQYKFGESTYYAWKSIYGGMSSQELKRLNEPERENKRLKQMYATLSMDHDLLKEVLEKK